MMLRQTMGTKRTIADAADAVPLAVPPRWWVIVPAS